MPIKYEIRKLADDAAHLTLGGKLDEHFHFQEVVGTLGNTRRVVIDMGGIRSISSLGVRSLEDFLGALHLGGRDVVLDPISTALANQLTMIPTLLGAATVRTARLPFSCGGCGEELVHAVPFERDAAAAHAPACPGCAGPMALDGFAEAYLPR